MTVIKKISVEHTVAIYVHLASYSQSPAARYIEVCNGIATYVVRYSVIFTLHSVSTCNL